MISGLRRYRRRTTALMRRLLRAEALWNSLRISQFLDRANLRVPPTSRINTLINELTFLLSSSLMRLSRRPSRSTPRLHTASNAKIPVISRCCHRPVASELYSWAVNNLEKLPLFVPFGNRSQTTTTGRLQGASMTMTNASSTVRGRRVKFTPHAIEKIKEFVAEGISRDEIANRLDVTVASLQVTCSRLGISLRRIISPNGSSRHTADVRGGTIPIPG